MKRLLLLSAALALLAAPAWAQTTISPTFDVKAHWDSQWEVGTGVFCDQFGGDRDEHGLRKEVRLTYHHSVVKPNLRSFVAQTVAFFGLEPTDKVLIFGAGFGVFEEWLREDHGFTEVVSADPSTWIQSAKDETEDTDLDAQCTWCGINPGTQQCRDLKAQIGDGGLRSRVNIVDETLATLASRNTIKQLFPGAGPDVVVTDFILPYLTDAEAVAVSINANSAAPVVMHTTNSDLATGEQARGERTVAYWQALMPNDLFFDLATR